MNTIISKTTLLPIALWLLYSIPATAMSRSDFKPLFNGQDLTGWKSVQEGNSPGTGHFSVNTAEQAIHAYAGKEADSKQSMDCLYTETQHSHYVLKLEYK